MSVKICAKTDCEVFIIATLSSNYIILCNLKDIASHIFSDNCILLARNIIKHCDSITENLELSYPKLR